MIDLGMLLECFRDSTLHVISSMANVEIETLDDAPEGWGSCELVGNVGLTGEMGISVTIGFSRGAISAIYKSVFPEDGDVDDTFKFGDLVGEITNVVCGNAKNMLTELDMQFQSSIPTVIIGAQSFYHPAGTITRMIHISVNGHPMLLEMNIKAF